MPTEIDILGRSGDVVRHGSLLKIATDRQRQRTSQMQNWTTRSKKPVLCLSAVTDEEESGGRLCEYWRTIFQARVEGPRHHQYEDILRYVQKAPDEIRWTIDTTEFDDLIAMKKDSAPGPGFQFLFNAYKYLLEVPFQRK